MVWEKRAAEGVFNNVVAPADFLDWERMNTVFEAMAALSSTTVDLTGHGEPVRLAAGVVTPRFFDVLRVRPQLGRTFLPADGIVGQHRVIVLGDVLRHTEPDMDIVPCFQPDNEDCPLRRACALKIALQRARQAFLDVLDGYTIGDLVTVPGTLRSLLGLDSAGA